MSNPDLQFIYNCILEHLLERGFTKLPCSGRMEVYPTDFETNEPSKDPFEVTKHPHFENKRKMVFCYEVDSRDNEINEIHIKGLDNTIILTALYLLDSKSRFTLHHDLNLIINGSYGSGKYEKLVLEDPKMFAKLDKILGVVD